MAMTAHGEGPVSIPTLPGILGTTSQDDEGEPARAEKHQGVNGRALPLPRKDGDPREQSQGCCWEADGAHTHYGCRQTVFAFVSQPTPRHTSHGAVPLPALPPQQMGSASLAPLPRLRPTSPAPCPSVTLKCHMPTPCRIFGQALLGCHRAVFAGLTLSVQFLLLFFNK